MLLCTIYLCFVLPFLKAWVKGSTWIPIFDTDDRFNVGTLSRKITGFMMGNAAIILLDSLKDLQSLFLIGATNYFIGIFCGIYFFKVIKGLPKIHKALV